MPDPVARPLVVTADPELLDELARLAAAAGIEIESALDLAAARRGWRSAPLVLVGAAALDEPGRLPERREGVVLIGSDLDDAGVWQRAVALGAEHVAFLPDAAEWLVERLADAVEGAERGRLLAVLGGRGGAGATTLACALAVTAARAGQAALLVDGDPLGGGIDLVVGGESAAGLRWPDLAGTRGRLRGAALREALPQVQGLTVLSWDRADALEVPAEAMGSVLGAAVRGSDLVVVDLGRRFDDATRLALDRSDLTLLVVPAEVRAAAAAARVAAHAALHARDLRVVVRGPAPSGLDGDFIAGSLGLPLAGELRAEPGLPAALERGEPPARRGRGPLATFSASLLEHLPPAAHRAA